MFSDFKRYEAWLPKAAPASVENLPVELRIYADDKIEVWYSPIGSRDGESEDLDSWDHAWLESNTDCLCLGRCCATKWG
jgi:hypothetical protein